MIIKGPRASINQDNFELELNNDIIECVDNVKYLGIMIDDRINFKLNCAYLCKKLAKKIGILGRL